MKVPHLRRVPITLLVAGALLGAGVLTSGAFADPPDPPPEGKIYVCHATSDVATGTQHYNLLTIAINAAFGPGEGSHFDESGSPNDGHEEDFVLVEPGGSLPPGSPSGVVFRTGLTCEDATALAVTFRSVTAKRVGGSVVLRWKTSSELDMLGYNVWIERNGKRVKLNKRLIMAKGNAGGSYSFSARVPKAKKGPVRMWLEVVNLDGSRSLRLVTAR